MSKNDDLRERMAQVIEQYLQLDNALRQAEGNHFRVCIFGSARIQPEDDIYKCVYEVSRQLAVMGIDVVTGGGPGLMEAANRAVRDANVSRVRSYGLPLDIPGLQEVANAHLDIKSMHQRFSSRLDEFMRLTDGVIVAPGGIGTLLELFYVWQLLQLAMVEKRPVILLGREFWSGLLDWMRDTVLANKMISPSDLEDVLIADTPDEAVAAIEPAFQAYREKRRAARAEMKSARTASLQKVEEEVEAAGSLLEDAANTLAHSVRSNGTASGDDKGPGGSRVVTPVDAANAAVTSPAGKPPRRRRRKTTRRI